MGTPSALSRRNSGIKTMRSLTSNVLVVGLLAVAGLVVFQVASGVQLAAARVSFLEQGTWLRGLSAENPSSLRSGHQCFDPVGDGAPEQRVCVFTNLLLYKGKAYYVADDPSVIEIPPIKYAWLKKFEGDDMFQLSRVSPTSLPFAWNATEVERIASAGLFHQQHFSNFYHLFSEVAPTMHHVVCKYLGDCEYSEHSTLRLFFMQDRRDGMPEYVMLDSLREVFRCLSPAPVYHKNDPAVANKVLILEKAVVGVSPEVRVFHNWEPDLRNNWKEPPREAMQVYRRRVAACFGVPFTEHSAVGAPLRILFINRHYEEGRSILNAAALAHKIRRLPEYSSFPGGASLDIRYLEADQSLREQAVLFWNASLLIWPHGATMSHTFFLPQGAQAIEIVPWVQADKANLPEWVQAIRDAYGLHIKLYDIQNKERARSMFNQDKLLEYEEYRRLTPDQKIALLERGECPPGVDAFLCPFWWNHWKVSVNFDWAQLEPVVKQALARLKAGWNAEPDLLPPKRLGPHNTPPSPPPPHAPRTTSVPATGQPTTTDDTKNEGPATRVTIPSTVVAYDWSTNASRTDQETGFPLSSYACVHDDGSSAHRYCVFRNLVFHGGAVYYLTDGDPTAAQIPEIQIAWEDWLLDKDNRGDKYFMPIIVNPEGLPAEARRELERAPEIVPRAALVHAVDTGNFYHLLSEVAATQFAGQCALLGLCDVESRKNLQLFFIQPDPTRRYAMPHAPRAAFECLGGGGFRYMRFPPVSSQALIIRHGIVGIGPYMRAYEKQEYRAGFQDPPPGVMTNWRHLLATCTSTGFDVAEAPTEPLRITFVNRPWSSGRSIVNVDEVVSWLRQDWLPGLALLKGRRAEVRVISEVAATTELQDQIPVFRDTSVLVYPHGATMTHAMFLPRHAAVLEVIPWPNVTEPHGWLQSIAKQMELDTLNVGLLVNRQRANLVLNWHGLAKDDVWASLPAEDKVNMQEKGICPPNREPECFFDWLHWKSQLVLDKDDLATALEPLLRAVLLKAGTT